MPRIPGAEIERLKQTISVARLAEARGITLARHGADLIGRCPFHDDKTPSLVITPAKNLWHCLGACQAGGTVIDWVMKAEGVSFSHAAELLQNDYSPLVADSGAAPAKRSTVKKLAMPLEREAEDAKLLVQVVTRAPVPSHLIGVTLVPSNRGRSFVSGFLRRWQSAVNFRRA